MTLGGLALLAGLLLAPAWILWYGHRLRNRTAMQRALFWGAVVGHALGVIVTATAALLPPVAWAGGPAWRDIAVHWSILAGLAVGIAAGVAIARARAPL